MRFEIRGQNIRLSDALRTHAERSVRLALGRFGARVSRVTVRVADLNGPRGGDDKRCRIAVAVQRAGNVVVEDTDVDLYAAIGRAAERAGRAVGRELDRGRELGDARPTRRDGGMIP